MKNIRDIEKYWDDEVCATRNAETVDDYEKNRSFEYRVTNSLVNYDDWKEKKIIDIGVGGGTEFLKFLNAGAYSYGIDLTQSAISYTYERAKDYKNLRDLQKANCENLEIFHESNFDLAFSYGVVHHSANPDKCVDEINKILKKNGTFIGMVYSDFSLTGIYLWLLHGLFKLNPFQTQKNIISKHLESPNTNCYSNKEWTALLESKGFEVITMYKMLSIGDALKMDLNLNKFPKWMNPVYNFIRFIMPTRFLMFFENFWGLNLCFIAKKIN